MYALQVQVKKQQYIVSNLKLDTHAWLFFVVAKENLYSLKEALELAGIY